MNDAAQQFSAAMRSAGLAPNASITSDGKIHRCNVEGDRRGKRNGWYVLHLDGLAAGAFGSWRTGESHQWSAKPERDMSREERDENRCRMDAARVEREAQEVKLREAARVKAKKLWESAGTVDPKHPYLVAKGVRPSGIKQLRQMLVVPVRDENGTLHSLQFIGADGSKRFLTGGKKAGCYALIGEQGNVLCIAEGLATGLSIHHATNHTVVVSFDAGNMTSVAKAIRAKYPDVRLIVCADDDHQTPCNPGITKATEAAQIVGALLTVPDFGDNRPADATDFNDLHSIKGLEVVKQAIDAAQAVDAPKTKAQRKDAPKSDTASCSHEAEQWEQPILFGRNVTPEITPDLLPGVFGEYAAALAEGLQVPRTMPTLFTLSVLSLALQRKFVVSPHGDDYAEPTCIWTATLADSGERKSAVIQRLLAPVLLWEAKRKDALAGEIAEVETLRAINQRRAEKLQGDAAKEDSPVRRGELVREIADLREQTPEPKLPPRLFTGDTTAERLQQMLMEHGGKMAVLTDEGGIFSVMAGIYSGGEAYVDIFLQAYSGSSVRVDRGSRTAVIDRPALTFGIGIQPGLIQDMQPAAKRKFRSSGLFARFFWGFPASNIGKRDMSRRGAVSPELVSRYRAAVMGLLDIQPDMNDLGDESEHILVLSDTARARWVFFAQRIEEEQADGGRLESLRDWCAKLPGGALRLAGLLHVAEHGHKNTAEIGDDTMHRAVKVCALLIPHAVAVFDMVGADPGVEDAKVLWRWIERQGKREVLRSECHKALHGRFAKVDRLIAAFEVLKGRSLVAGPHKAAGSTNKPTIFYRVSPLAMEGVKP